MRCPDRILNRQLRGPSWCLRAVCGNRTLRFSPVPLDFGPRTPPPWSTISVVNYLLKVGDHTTPLWDDISLTNLGPAAVISARSNTGAHRSRPRRATSAHQNATRKKSLFPFSHKNSDLPRSVSSDSGIDDAGRQRAGCGSDPEFEPRQGASENSPGCSTLGNAGRKELRSAGRGRQNFFFCPAFSKTQSRAATKGCLFA